MYKSEYGWSEFNQCQNTDQMSFIYMLLVTRLSFIHIWAQLSEYNQAYQIIFWNSCLRSVFLNILSKSL